MARHVGHSIRFDSSISIDHCESVDRGRHPLPTSTMTGESYTRDTHTTNVTHAIPLTTNSDGMDLQSGLDWTIETPQLGSQTTDGQDHTT
jgi:hypothetical protein